MSYGLNVFDSSGNLTLSDTDTLWRFYNSYSTTLSGGTQTGTITVSGIADDGNWCVFVTGSVIRFNYKITANTITYYVQLPTTGTYTINFNVLTKGGSVSSSSYGFVSYANAGNVQIDPSYDNYVLIGSGNGISPGLSNAVSLPTGYTTDNCLILVRPTSSVGALNGGGPYYSSTSTPPDNTKIWVSSAYNSAITIPGTIVNSTGTWDYRIYTKNSFSATNPNGFPAYNSGYGLNVFDAFGNNVFSSNRIIPIVNSFFTQSYTPGTYSTVSNTYTINSARTGTRTYTVYRNLNPLEEQYGFGNPPTLPYGIRVVGAFCNWNSSTQVQIGGCLQVRQGVPPSTQNGPGYITHVFMDSV